MTGCPGINGEATGTGLLGITPQIEKQARQHQLICGDSGCPDMLDIKGCASFYARDTISIKSAAGISAR